MIYSKWDMYLGPQHLPLLISNGVRRSETELPDLRSSAAI